MLGLGDVYLGAPVATPLDPRHRLVTTKYNPARTWTPENAVGIGGAYLCIYGMEGPGGYQFVGRTVQVWNRHRTTREFEPGQPWLLRFFDQIRFHPVGADALLRQREAFLQGRAGLDIEHATFRIGDYQRFLADEAAGIEAFRATQRRAFGEERARWRAAGQDLASDAGLPEAEARPAVVVPAGARAIRSPLPGVVWKKSAEPGRRVEAGDVLYVLEAMKTEAEVRAPVAGEVVALARARAKPWRRERCSSRSARSRSRLDGDAAPPRAPAGRLRERRRAALARARARARRARCRRGRRPGALPPSHRGGARARARGGARATRPCVTSAVRPPLRDQGQHRRGRRADDRGLSLLRVPARAFGAGGRSASRRRAPCSSARRTWISSRRAWSARVRRAGTPRNPFDARYVPGGSSSGSAVALARGLVSFALGTDTAGSGRVPAAFNQVLGLKPTRGLISMRGVVPAVRSLDCISIFAPTSEDAGAVLGAAAAFDAADPFSRRGVAALAPGAKLRFGVLADPAREVGADAEAVRLTEAAAARLAALGHERVAVDAAPFTEAAALLYGGPWVAERYAAVGEFLESGPPDADPIVRGLILASKERRAFEQHRASYRLAELRREAEATFAQVDVLLLPTTPTIPTLADVARDPVGVGEALGRTNNFANLFDLAAVTVPAGLRADGLPAGVTLFAPAFSETWLLPLAGALHRAAGVAWGATGVALPEAPKAPASGPPKAPASGPAPDGRVPLAVVGAHLRGQPLHPQLVELGARFVWAGRTAPVYRLYALAGSVPPKPGMIRDEARGAGIQVEVWSLSPEAFGRFVAGVPAPLCIGTVQLEDGRAVHGFLCESAALAGAREITTLGGWLAYRKSVERG